MGRAAGAQPIDASLAVLAPAGMPDTNLFDSAYQNPAREYRAAETTTCVEDSVSGPYLNATRIDRGCSTGESGRARSPGECWFCSRFRQPTRDTCWTSSCLARVRVPHRRCSGGPAPNAGHHPWSRPREGAPSWRSHPRRRAHRRCTSAHGRGGSLRWTNIRGGSYDALPLRVYVISIVFISGAPPMLSCISIVCLFLSISLMTMRDVHFIGP